VTAAVTEPKHVRTSGNAEILVQNPSKEINIKVSANDKSIICCDSESASLNIPYRLVTVCLLVNCHLPHLMTSGILYAIGQKCKTRCNSKVPKN
jgi:hypothetical protein